MKVFVTTLLLLIMLPAYAYSSQAGTVAPDFSLGDLSGKPFTLKQFKGKVVFLDFWAPWCGPCKMIAPVLEEIARQQEGRLLVAKVNTDENYEWAMKYGVQGIPTLLFVSGGKIVDRQVGALPAPALKAKAENLLKAAHLLTVEAN